MSENVRVLTIGCGNMGRSHALAYHKLDGFEVAGLVDKFPEARGKLAEEIGGAPEFDDFDQALAETKPDAVSICTYPETHADFALKALEADCHIFVEKPVAVTVEAAERVVKAVQEKGKKMVIGYILRHHPSWIKFIEISHTLGSPLVMRMNLNQQSSGKNWETHKSLMNSMSPIVDCGVHYVDVMCLMTRSRPVRVSAIGARLSEELNDGMYNYGQLQVTFEDGSVGWYEAGWGPMMSETAYFVKDVVGPKGCVSIVAKSTEGDVKSDDVDAHCKTESLLVHASDLKPDGTFVKEDEFIDLADEPDHYELCTREQAYFLKAIREDLDLTDHMNDAVNSLRIVLAADESFRTGKTVEM